MMQNPTVAIAKTCVPSGGVRNEKTNEVALVLCFVLNCDLMPFYPPLSSFLILFSGLTILWVVLFTSNDAYILFTDFVIQLIHNMFYIAYKICFKKNIYDFFLNIFIRFIYYKSHASIILLCFEYTFYGFFSTYSFVSFTINIMHP